MRPLRCVCRFSSMLRPPPPERGASSPSLYLLLLDMGTHPDAKRVAPHLPYSQNAFTDKARDLGTGTTDTDQACPRPISNVRRRGHSTGCSLEISVGVNDLRLVVKGLFYVPTVVFDARFQILMVDIGRATKALVAEASALTFDQ